MHMERKRRLSFDDKITPIYCLADGSRHIGAPGSWTRDAAEEDQEERFDRLADLRRRLQVAAGSEVCLAELLKQLDTSYRKMAAETGRNPGALKRSFDRKLADLHASLIAQAAIEALQDDATGCVIDPFARPIEQVDGWAVSLYRTATWLKALPDHADCKRFLRRHPAALVPANALHLGVWRDGDHGSWCLVLAVLVPSQDRQFAEVLGLINQQQSIFNLTTRELVRLHKPLLKAASF